MAAILLVGGSSRIPLVGQLVAARLQRPIAVDARPEDTISVGAAPVAMDAAAAPAPTLAPGPLAAPSPSPGPPLAPRPGPPLRDPAADPPGPPATGAPPPDTDRAARTRRLVAVALGAVIVAAVGIVALTRDGGDDTASTTTTIGGTGDPTTTEDTSPTTEPASDDVLPLPGDDWNDQARTQFLTDRETHLADEFALGSVSPTTACTCISDTASTDPAWTFAELSDVRSADDLDLSGPGAQRFGSLVLDCAGI